jgi:hypothetical protein
VRSGLVACCWLVFGPMSDLNSVANSPCDVTAAAKCEFKKLKKLVTSEPIERKGVTNFFVDRKIKELKRNYLM